VVIAREPRSKLPLHLGPRESPLGSSRLRAIDLGVSGPQQLFQEATADLFRSLARLRSKVRERSTKLTAALTSVILYDLPALISAYNWLTNRSAVLPAPGTFWS
jgi:hypothetical protein